MTAAAVIGTASEDNSDDNNDSDDDDSEGFDEQDFGKNCRKLEYCTSDFRVSSE